MYPKDIAHSVPISFFFLLLTFPGLLYHSIGTNQQTRFYSFTTLFAYTYPGNFVTTYCTLGVSDVAIQGYTLSGLDRDSRGQRAYKPG